MRLLARAALVLTLLLVLALGALAVLMPRIVKSDAVRERIESAARVAVGREIRYEELDFGLFPPSLLVVGPTVAGPTPKHAPLLEAEELALRVALLPLLARTVVVDSLVLERATVRLVRTRNGIELPRARPAADAAAAEQDAPVALALRSFALRDATLFIDDRSVEPAVAWELREVDARARGRALDEPFEFEVSLRLATGGRLTARGKATLGGAIDVEVDLHAVELAPAGPYLDPGSSVAGQMTGKISAEGPTADPSAIEADVEIHDGDFTIDEIAVRGHVTLRADVTGGVANPSGSFDLDATDAELRYGDAFRKAPGAAATVRGRIVSDPDGTIGIDDVELRIGSVDARGQVRLGRRTRVVARVAPFDLKGWDAMIPALEGYALAGPVELGEVVVVTAPLEVLGAVRFDGVTARLAGRDPVQLRGALVAEGSSIRTDGLTLVAADQVIAVEGTLRDLGANPRYRFRVGTQDADTNRLVTTFAGKPDALYGLLDFRGDLAGSLGGPRSPLETAQGSLVVDVRDGRIVGVSLLRAVFDRLGAFGPLAALAGQLFAPPQLQRFYGDDFESISGTLQIARGVARTDDFRIVYRAYSVDLRGTLGLTDLAIDMVGTLTIGEEIDAVLSRDPGAPARRRTIPLAAVGGSLDAPRVQVTPQALRTFASLYGLGGSGGPLEELIDRGLGSGSGAGVLDALENLLGGPSKR